MDELRQAAESMKRTYSANDPEQASDEAHTIHNPVVKGNETQHEGVTPAAAETQVSAPEQKSEPVKANEPESTETASVATIDAEKKSAAPVVESSPRRVINRKHGCRRYSTAYHASDRVA